MPAPNKPGWKFVFGDEFDGAVFSENNYFNPTGTWAGGGGTHGTELQYYTRFNKHFPTPCNKGGLNYVQSCGTLQIIAKDEKGYYEVYHWDESHVTKDNPKGFFTECNHYDYTSGWIQSMQTFLYGFFEIRCKIPNQGVVLWPAFWLYGGGESTAREIDIFEFGAGIWNQNEAGFNIHISRELDNGRVQADNDPINHYRGRAIVPGPSNVTDDFHTYALKWSPNCVIWYIDGNECFKVAAHTPHMDMHVIANLAIAQWCPPTAISWTTPSSCTFEIDYIRVYQSLTEEFLFQWGNGGAYKIGGWNMNSGDTFIAGDFDHGGRDGLLAFAVNGWSKLIKYDGAAWHDIWHNNGSHTISGWNLNAGDDFLVGDFDHDGDDEVLAFAVNGWSKLIKYDGAAWHDIWHNNGSHAIGGWNLNSGDKFLVGDFDHDGRDELLAFAVNGWSKLIKFDGAAWHDIWHNNGNHSISGWILNSEDKFLVGDFDHDGRDELLAIGVNGWCKLMKYDGAAWHDIWHNNGSGNILWWHLNPTDRFVTGDFEKVARDELLAVSQNGWSYLMRFDGFGWQFVWGNDGGETIHFWHMQSTDKYLGGDFDGDGKANLLALSVNGWSQLLQMGSILQY